jgi:hypothetical protein
MANTLQTTINWTQAMSTQYLPLSAGTGSEPAISIANMLVNRIFSAPLVWSFNRATKTAALTAVGGQDYVVSATDFGFLEKVSLTDSNNAITEITKVFNTEPLSLTSQQSRPENCAIQTSVPGTSFTARFLNAPDANYTATFTYQKAPVAFTTLSQGWLSQTGIPDWYSDIYNNLFLAEAFTVADDTRATYYRQRGVAALLAKAEGLTAMQRNVVLAQWGDKDAQALVRQLQTQQGQQAQAV